MNSMKSVNIDIKDDTLKVNQMKLAIDKLYQENNEMKKIISEQNITISEQNITINEQKINIQELNVVISKKNVTINELNVIISEQQEQNKTIDKITEIKQQIASEFETLRIKNEDYDTLNTELRLKEVEHIKKDNELKQMLINYDYLFKSQYLQLEITNNKSSYLWPMNEIQNVMSIKLLSYSLPVPRFNIEENKNNLLSLKINNEIIEIVIPTGKYTIDELINVINTKFESNIDSKVKISINNEQKIIIEGINKEDIIEIIPTVLSNNNLGFSEQPDTLTFKYISDKCWDLRIEDKIYLYLNNLSDETPFGILYFNGLSTSHFKFQEPFNLNNLEIIFKDSKGYDYNFYNLSHSLSFLIEKIN